MRRTKHCLQNKRPNQIVSTTTATITTKTDHLLVPDVVFCYIKKGEPAVQKVLRVESLLRMKWTSLQQVRQLMRAKLKHKVACTWATGLAQLSSSSPKVYATHLEQGAQEVWFSSGYLLPYLCPGQYGTSAHYLYQNVKISRPLTFSLKLLGHQFYAMEDFDVNAGAGQGPQSSV